MAKNPSSTVESDTLVSGGYANGTTRAVAGGQLLRSLLNDSLVAEKKWDALSLDVQSRLSNFTDDESLLVELVKRELLTDYQSRRIQSGERCQLIINNYRILDLLGSGGMGDVYKAEHLLLRRTVAIKVLDAEAAQGARAIQRFLVEMEAVARLNHPNIVGALDAGTVRRGRPQEPPLYYLVMEYVPGKDLEEYVETEGPLNVGFACDLIYQVAEALTEAHKHEMVHRDIKPSNVLLSAENQVKLLDFGLARPFRSRLTDPGTMLGTLQYVAPEQLQDASSADVRSDIYGLGGTLFWCLTGITPFHNQDQALRDMLLRFTQEPPSVRSHRPSVPAEVDAVVRRMMSPNPADRYPNTESVMRAVRPFMSQNSREIILQQAHVPATPALGEPAPAAGARQILIVDDEADVRMLCRYALEAEGFVCEEAANGIEALVAARERPFDLILTDLDMPMMNGVELLQELRNNPPNPHLKIILLSGRSTADEMAQMMQAGADDYLAKPIGVIQLRSRTKTALQIKYLQDRSAVLNRNLLAVNSELEQNLTNRDSDLIHARNALVLGLAKLVEQRSHEPSSHLNRLQRYCRNLAEEAARLPMFAADIDPTYIQMLECCVPLHDVGKISLPDSILHKPGKFEFDEQLSMQAHTILGAETLQEIFRRHGSALAFLQMAIDIARHHHERYDGTGYPDRLAGNAIPLAARIVAIGDVYDALRSRRTYRPALSHHAALQVMTKPGAFDPHLLKAFQQCSPRFERIFLEFPD
jgi:response regulator RpfG family c-di-GMP phosphodiesterase/serine/threonine protein kinase